MLNFGYHRLRVPKYNAILDFLNFTILLVVFVLCMSSERCSILGSSFPMGHTDESVALYTDADLAHVTIYEICFIVIAISFTLAEYTASREHGVDGEFLRIWE